MRNDAKRDASGNSLRNSEKSGQKVLYGIAVCATFALLLTVPRFWAWGSGALRLTTERVEGSACTRSSISQAGVDFCLRCTACGFFDLSGCITAAPTTGREPSRACDAKWSWNSATSHCGYRFFDAAQSEDLLGNRTVLLMGDSQSRYFFSAAVAAISDGGHRPSGAIKRLDDEWQTQRKGRLVYQSVKFAEDLAATLAGLVSAGHAAADAYVINCAHWDAAFRSTAAFSDSFPAIVAGLEGLARLAVNGSAGRKPLIIWQTPNYVWPQLYQKMVNKYGTQHGNADRPDIVTNISSIVARSRLLGPSGVALPLDFMSVTRMRQDWVREPVNITDVVHSKDEMYAFGWQLLLNILEAAWSEPRSIAR